MIQAGFKLEGSPTCIPKPPIVARRVFYCRTQTGGPTIYLYHGSGGRLVKGNYATHAFGWIPVNVAVDINLEHRFGWCNFYPAAAPGHAVIVFTDDITQDASLIAAVVNTKFSLQNAHWSEPRKAPTGASLKPQPKEPDMATGQFDPYAAAAAQQARLSGKQPVNNLKQKCSTALASAVDNNKAAAVDAGFLAAGKIANDQFQRIASGHLPMMVRGYAATPIGRLVLANTAQLLIQHFKADSKAANRLAEAMMTQAMGEVIASTGITDMIDDFLSDPKLSKALKVVDTD